MPSHHSHHARNFVYDVTRQVRELLGDGTTTSGLRVALVASTGTSEVLTDQARSFYENAGLQIAEIKLRVEARPGPSGWLTPQ